MRTLSRQLGLIFESRAFRNGYATRLEGGSAAANPFDANSSLGADWGFGWQAASRSIAANENRKLVAEQKSASPFGQGAQAAQNGRRVSANPYPFGSPDHEAWRLGWANTRVSLRSGAAE